MWFIVRGWFNRGVGWPCVESGKRENPGVGWAVSGWLWAVKKGPIVK